MGTGTFTKRRGTSVGLESGFRATANHTMSTKIAEWNHEEFMRAAAVARIAVELAVFENTDPEVELGPAWDLVDKAIQLRREVLGAGIPLK